MGIAGAVVSQEAADMILLTDDFSAIVMGIEEGRCIYPRLRSYVLYRISATIQIVTVLSTLVFAYDIVIPAFYVILLALLNDITMLTVSYDNVTPSLPGRTYSFCNFCSVFCCRCCDGSLFYRFLRSWI